MTGTDSAAERRALIDLDALRKDAQITLDAALATGRERDDAGALLALVEAVEAVQRYCTASMNLDYALDVGEPWQVSACERERVDAFVAMDAAVAAFAPGTGASWVASGRATTEEGGLT